MKHEYVYRGQGTSAVFPHTKTSLGQAAFRHPFKKLKFNLSKATTPSVVHWSDDSHSPFSNVPVGAENLSSSDLPPSLRKERDSTLSAMYRSTLHYIHDWPDSAVLYTHYIKKVTTAGTPGHPSLLPHRCGRPPPPQVKSKSVGNTDRSNAHAKLFKDSRRNSLESHENERKRNMVKLPNGDWR